MPIKLEDHIIIVDEARAARDAHTKLRRAILDTITECRAAELPPQAILSQIEHELAERHPTPAIPNAEADHRYYSKMRGRIIAERERQRRHRRRRGVQPKTQDAISQPSTEPPAEPMADAEPDLPTMEPGQSQDLALQSEPQAESDYQPDPSQFTPTELQLMEGADPDEVLRPEADQADRDEES